MGRWELVDSENVSEYIDNENGPMLYTVFGKRMKPDIEYVKLDDDSYIAKIYLEVMRQPMKIPMRLDQSAHAALQEALNFQGLNVFFMKN